MSASAPAHAHHDRDRRGAAVVDTASTTSGAWAPPQPALPIIEVRYELPADARARPTCGGTLTELAGQAEAAAPITTVKATHHIERHVRQKYRCACNGAVVTAPA